MEIFLLLLAYALATLGGKVFSKLCSNTVTENGEESYTLFMLINGLVACLFFAISGGFSISLNLTTVLYSVAFALLVALSLFLTLVIYRYADVASVGVITGSMSLLGSANYGAWGIYLDEGTSFVRVEGNLIYRTRSECFNQHYGSHNTITRNIFIAHTAPCFRVERQEPHNSLTLTENIFVTEDTPAYARDISFSFQSSHNLFLTAGEQPLVFVSKDGTPYPLATWQSAFDKDEGSTTRPLTTSPQSFLETLLVLTNLSCALDKIDARIRVNIPFTKAIFSAIDDEREVLIEANELTVKGITDGGIIILR